MRQITPTRHVKSIRDINLKLLKADHVAKIKAQRKAYRERVAKQQAKAHAITGRQKGVLQKKLSTKQLKRQETHIRRNIAKQKRLKYQWHGGDIAFKDIKVNTPNWYNNFSSSNVWKFKIRGNNLLVAFLNGSVYMYFGVAKMFIGMVRSGSKGSYVWKQLRRKEVAYTQII